MTKIILLNGPPRSGKDMFATIVNRTWAGKVSHRKFSRPLKDAVNALFQLTPAQAAQAEAQKDDALTMLGGMTYREAQIWLSESCMKPALGTDIFGRIFVHAASSDLTGQLIVVSDSGFAPEALVVRKHFGANNILVVRLSRPGCDFSDDSRTHWIDDEPMGRWQVEQLDNVHDLEMYALQCRRIVSRFTGWERPGT